MLVVDKLQDFKTQEYGTAPFIIFKRPSLGGRKPFPYQSSSSTNAPIAIKSSTPINYPSHPCVASAALCQPMCC